MDDRPGPAGAERPGGTPRKIRIGGRVYAFAAAGHEGWPRFFERIGRSHNAYRTIRPFVDGLPDELRRYAIGLALDALIDDPSPLTREAAAFLDSPAGTRAMLVEGIALAEPGSSRADLERQLGALTAAELAWARRALDPRGPSRAPAPRGRHARP